MLIILPSRVVLIEFTVGFGTILGSSGVQIAATVFAIRVKPVEEMNGKEAIIRASFPSECPGAAFFAPWDLFLLLRLLLF